MTIMKAIAMSALAGSLLADPGAAIAQTTEHGNSAKAHMDNAARKDAHELDKATRTQERNDRKAAHVKGEAQGKALGQPNFGTLVSSLHRNGGATSNIDLSNLSDSYQVQQIDLSSFGNKSHAIQNALRNVNSETIQTTLSADADLTTAIETKLGTTDLSTVAYAYVNANGDLVVFTNGQ